MHVILSSISIIVRNGWFMGMGMDGCLLSSHYIYKVDIWAVRGEGNKSECMRLVGGFLNEMVGDVDRIDRLSFFWCGYVWGGGWVGG